MYISMDQDKLDTIWGHYVAFFKMYKIFRQPFCQSVSRLYSEEQKENW